MSHPVEPLFTVDHLVVAATTLDAGIDYVEQHLQVPLQPGGQHRDMGTHNALLHLGPRCYLEVIAIDPTLPSPRRARWFALDSPRLQQRLRQGPALIHWVMRRSSPAAAADANDTGRFGPALTLSRGPFNWTITVPEDGSLPGNGILPSLIHWHTSTHPADALPDRGCRLHSLTAGVDNPESSSSLLRQLGMENFLRLENSTEIRLQADIDTPRGLRVLG